MPERAHASPADRVMIEDRYLRTKEFIRVLAHLISVAERGEPTGYAEVAEIVGLPRSGHHMSQQTGQMLGAISKRELECGRPLLSAIVVRAGDRQPGPGFFFLARYLGQLPEGASSNQEEAFLKAQQAAVYAE